MTTIPDLLHLPAYPHGAIRSFGELQDLIREARQERSTIKLHMVCAISFKIYPVTLNRSATVRTVQFDDGTFYEKLVTHPTKDTQDEFALTDYNITESNGEEGGYNRNCMFTNRMWAEKYLKSLIENTEYRQALHDQQMVDALFDAFIESCWDHDDDLDNEIDYDDE